MVFFRKCLRTSMEAPRDPITSILKPLTRSILLNHCSSAGFFAGATISLNRIQSDSLNQKRFIPDRFFTGKQMTNSLEFKSPTLQFPLAQTLAQLHHVLLQAVLEG